jgi:hypothetical protein
MNTEVDSIPKGLKSSSARSTKGDTTLKELHLKMLRKTLCKALP